MVSNDSHGEAEWRKLIRSPNEDAGSGRVLAICGPSGVGKTTVVAALATSYPAFIETTEGNPYLNGLMEGKSDFNATANQKWFLHRIGDYITHASPRSPLVLDQDPAAIVLSYSRMFHDDGKITEAQYATLLNQLLQIEKTLHGWKSPRTVLFLDAPADVLQRRFLKRQGKSSTPPLEWFDRTRNHFVQLFTRFPNAITISTVQYSPEQIISRARKLVEDRTEETQA